MPERDSPFENLENLQEEAVLEAVRRLVEQEALRRPDMCTCDRCLVDIAALALNALAPRYVADRFNKFPSMDEATFRYEGQVEAAVNTAINLVARRPHH